MSAQPALFNTLYVCSKTFETKNKLTIVTEHRAGLEIKNIKLDSGHALTAFIVFVGFVCFLSPLPATASDVSASHGMMI